MAEITLRDYLAKLDTLLNTGHSSEVIHHCRQILQYFPKNVEAYRYLGRALVDTKSWREAGEVLRRVLSVYPDDFFAHAGLSEVYINEKQFDKAIWHLERAFDQDPNNESILTALRELYRKHRHVEHVKVQLTAGAVARQYIRNGLYPQAIDSLQQAIQHAPDRVDIKLLLAETFWGANMRVEAAEVALEVVKALPDCLEANRILTELWLGESRPSDAQRYISHIQSVDPYLALELAQGQTLPGSAFKLEELDYRRAAEREIVSQSPDWLQAIDQSAEAGAASSEAASDWMSMSAAAKPAAADDDELPDMFNDSFSSELPHDWLKGSSATPAEAAEDLDELLPPPTPRVRTGLTGLLSTLNTPESEAKPAPAEPEPAASAPIEDDMPDLEFSAPTDFAAPELAAAEEEALPTGSTMDDLFPDLEAPAAPKPRQTGALMDSDPLAWMRDTGVELVEDQSAPPDDDLFGVGEDATPDAPAADPLAWLKDSGGEDLILETDDNLPRDIVEDDFTGSLPGDDAEEDDDPLAWLKDSGGEVIPEPSPTSAMGGAAKADDDPLDWLADQSMLDEALSMEALIESPSDSSTSEEPALGSVEVPATAEMPDRQENMADDKNNDLDWLNSPSSEPEPEPENFTWADQSSSSMNEDFPDLFAGVGDEQPAQPEANAAADDLDWMSGADEDAVKDVPDWLEEAAPAATPAAASTETPADDAGFEWMTEAAASSDAPAEDVDVPDWLSEMQPEAAAATTTDEPDAIAAPTAADDSGFEWMPEAEVSSEAAAADVDVPDWLSQMQPESASEAEPTASVSAPADDSGFEWMPEAEVSSEAAAADVDVPDWLSQMQPESASEAEPTAAVSAPADDSGFEWMPEAEASSEAAAADVDVPDWLSQMQPESASEAEPTAQPSETLPVDDGGFEWVAQPGDAAVDAVASGEAPDWMADLQAEDQGELAAEAPNRIEAELADAPDDLSNWLAEAQADDVGELAAEAPNRLETELSTNDDGAPRWLTETNQFEVPVAASDEMKAVEAVADSDAPDWLSQMQPEAAAEPVAEAGEPDWMSDMLPADEAASPADADVPDWLSQMQPEASSEPVAATPDSGDIGFSWETPEPEAEQPVAEHMDWLPETDEDVIDEPISEETPDWLTQIQTGEHQSAVDEEITPTGTSPEFSWETELGDHAEPAVAVDAPDWLQEMQPEASTEPEQQDETAVAGDVPDWLSSMQTEAPPPAAVPRSLAETRDLDDTAYSWENKTEANEAVTDDTPDWLTEVQPEADLQAADSPIDDDTPDWLKEMQPAASEMGTAAAPQNLSWLEANDEENTELATAQPESELERSDMVEEDDLARASLLHLDSLEAETAPIPATNAPDWLNAMVPGLDVDFDAPEDEPIEQEFMPGSENRAELTFQSASTPARSNREFDWLVDIVEEETQQMGAMKSQPRRKHFVFSREPVWLRPPTEKNDASASVAAGNTAVAENKDDNWDEVDLPPWLQ